ncbi:hypothetical protein BDV93DRAFT_529077 [Ceratobasidium sp. AG-I]|nr:hypothetical protein BDV93DRAFT_529077 [Ceratobasidium sp. AG-I]
MPASSATELKEKGNTAFKTGDFRGAIAHYNGAILADPTNLTFTLNRAAAYLKLNKNEEAERDCSTVLKAQENNTKALYRRAQARIALKKLPESRQDLEAASKIEPSNATVRAELATVKILIEDEADTSGLPEMLRNRVIRLKKRFRDFQATQKFPAQSSEPFGNGQRKPDDDEETKASKRVFLKILRDTCALIREGEAWRSPDLPALVDAIHKVTDRGILLANGFSQMFEYLPSWAHDAENESPFLEDPDEKDGTIPRTELAGVLSDLSEGRTPAKVTSTEATAWKPTMKRHPKTSKLARFRRNLPGLTPVPFNALATSVYDARCEVSSHRTSTPIRLRLSEGKNILALNTATGWKNRGPGLYYFLLDDQDLPVEERPAFPESRFLEPGLTGVANDIAVDEGYRRIFVGDEKRIKSYSWEDPGGGVYASHPIPVHTLNSAHATGPIIVMPNGNVVRAGKGGAAIWNISDLPTHGPSGKKLIGKKVDVQDTSRDDPENIEPSSGSPPVIRIKFGDEPTMAPGVWRLLPQKPSMILSSTAGKGVPDYGCITIDLDKAGRTAARYLGHGGEINEFSTSSGDPQVFLTACKDGYARLFDIRRPLPVCTFHVGYNNESCEGIALAHPDGIPTVFTGSTKGEHIKMWDVRAGATVYELSTGNNQVASLAWDASRNTLFAATECLYLDRMGYRHSYRPARIPNRSGPAGGVESPVFYWPDRAPHAEDYYEYAFDAGEHRVYQYAFKENPNLSIVPEYGEARAGEEYTFR